MFGCMHFEKKQKHKKEKERKENRKTKFKSFLHFSGRIGGESEKVKSKNM